MKIVIVSAFYSIGMGYSENCLPKALAFLGHEVHVISSNLNVYGNSSTYRNSYESFLGAAEQPLGMFKIDGYTVHRLSCVTFFGYVYINNLIGKVKEISPDILHSTEIASLNTFFLAALKPWFTYKLFTETHQHLSVVKPYMKTRNGNWGKKLIYRLTRTLPSHLASKRVEKCFAIAPDCVEVAHKYYGVPLTKIQLQPLGTDTDLFRAPISNQDFQDRIALRERMGFKNEDIVCIYTGRFANDKNPLLLARAIEILADSGLPFHGIFIGDGLQRVEIEGCTNSRTLPFMRHVDLANYYRAADIGVWPMQESMSMLDAASCGLPIIVSDKIGEMSRVEGNGKVYEEGNLASLVNALKALMNKEDRLQLGRHGTQKMICNYSWINVAKKMEHDFLSQKL